MEETLQISVDEEIREELNDMTSLLDGILERREKEAKVKIIQNMLADHTPYEKIKLYTNATDAEIAEVEKEMWLIKCNSVLRLIWESYKKVKKIP